MGKRIKVTKSKSSESFYIIDDYVNPETKKRSTFVFERLGTMKRLKEEHNITTHDEAMEFARNRLAELRRIDELENAKVIVELSQSKFVSSENERLYNIGYLYIRNILSSLKFKDICNSVSQNYRSKFDLYSIVSDLVCARIIYPGSKRSSYKDAHSFIEAPTYQLEDVYRSLPILSKERYAIESELYKNSKLICERDNTILFYDCTNFYFEIEEEDDLRKYGKSKENRPNPIVQYGLFMDRGGIPISDIVYEGNKNEQFSLRELESIVEKDFQFSKFVVCADAGLNGWENKVYNDRKTNGAYIVSQPIKKLKKNLKEWAVDPKGWRIIGQDGIYDINDLPKTMVINGKETKINDITFYKDRWETTTKKTEQAGKKYTLEEHIIVTFNNKFKEYQNRIREKKLERARKLLENPGKISTNNPRDPRYYIKECHTTGQGEVAGETHYAIDESKINEDSKYDGFYAVATDLEDEDLSLIIQSNKQRWEIEESFEIMKSEFKSRPMYVSTEEAINGHLLTCFMALLVYRILEKVFLKEKYTCPEIIDTLKKLNVTHLKGDIYTPSYKGSEIIIDLTKEFGFEPLREALTQKYLKKFSRTANAKKSTKMK